MRVEKFFFAGIVAAALTASPSSAQRTAPFEDSWFWGLKGGVNTFSTGLNGTASVPTWGTDWLITRDHGGLYVSADQAFFSRTVTSDDATSPNGRRDVQIRNLNRFGFAAIAFPSKIGIFTPYGGVGAAISLIGHATARADTLGGAAGQPFIDATEKARSRASLLVMAGIQTQSSRVGFFIQETLLPGGKEFLVKNAMSILEVGLRHSFGSPSESEH
jgi:hypothetical protein